MRYWLKLIRWPNLVIVALTMYVLQFKLLLPSLENHLLFGSLSRPDFYLLILMTMLATAAGYIINDWFDYKIDLVNKPNKVILNKKITWRSARRSYLAFIVTGAFISSYLSSKTGLWGITILYNTVCILLFLYARFFKRSFLIGNFVISLLCCFVPLLVWYVNHSAFNNLETINQSLFIFTRYILFGFIAFSFLITFFREIVKDIEDIEGDKKYLARTLPIILGIKNSKIIAGVAGVLILLGIGLLGSDFYLKRGFNTTFILGSILFLLQAWSVFLLKQATKKEQFGQLSLMLKICMFLGLLWLMLPMN